MTSKSGGGHAKIAFWVYGIYPVYKNWFFLKEVGGIAPAPSMAYSLACVCSDM